MLTSLLDGYEPGDDTEAADLIRLRSVISSTPDVWARSTPVHVTGSALIVDPAGRVLLRWHQRLGEWLQVGGHGDPGETDPHAIALREAVEETHLTDLSFWPDRRLRHLAIVHVPAGKGEPEHEHADLRFFLRTADPSAARPEDDGSPLRWLPVDEAMRLTGNGNLRVTLSRLAALLPGLYRTRRAKSKSA